jgi:lipopolysaccharide/colanic/teichoic acid biosynthesis glycosyltransferase
MLTRSFDIAVASAGLLIMALPMLLIAAAIKIFDSGPVFYRQRRIGLGGKPFWLYKFRSMKVSQGGPAVTGEGDSRITAVGRVLRKWKLDEVPQLFNVLKGDMSIVGPRPEAETLTKNYTAEQRRLLNFKPGIAGLSQLVYPHEAEILGRCPNPEEVYLKLFMPRKIAIDLEYEERRTFWSDLLLLGEILVFVIRRDTARKDVTLGNTLTEITK